jgi:enoyl-CoA hydratase/carnithine racemase
MTESEFFQVELLDGVARCTMRGHTMNAMSKEMLPPMIEMLSEVLADDAVRVIVIRGDGGNSAPGRTSPSWATRWTRSSSTTTCCA